MQSSEKVPVVGHSEIQIDAPLEAVWRVQADIDGWSTWHPDVSRSELKGPLAPGTVFRWASGGTPIRSVLREVEPERRLSWTGRALGTRAVHVWTFEAHEGGTCVRTEESMEGWPVRLFRGSMQRMLDQGLRTWLEHLKQAVE